MTRHDLPGAAGPAHELEGEATGADQARSHDARIRRGEPSPQRGEVGDAPPYRHSTELSRRCAEWVRMALLHRARCRYNGFWGRGMCEPPAPVRPTCGQRRDHFERRATSHPGEQDPQPVGPHGHAQWLTVSPAGWSPPHLRWSRSYVATPPTSTGVGLCCQNVVNGRVRTALPASVAAPPQSAARGRDVGEIPLTAIPPPRGSPRDAQRPRRSGAATVPPGWALETRAKDPAPAGGWGVRSGAVSLGRPGLPAVHDCPLAITHRLGRVAEVLLLGHGRHSVARSHRRTG